MKKSTKKIFIVTLLIVMAILYTSFKFGGLKKSIYYYPNFISFIAGSKTASSYFAFFDRNTPWDYEIARFIKPKLEKNDMIFVWGNNAQLYKLTNSVPITKYVVAYHISNYKDGITSTKKALEKTKPKFIIVMLNQKSIPFSLLNYYEKIIIGTALIYERAI